MNQTTTEQPTKVTPMMQQYLGIREENKGYLLLYRLGDFYEMFYDDAERVSADIELTLTSRAGVPMCGIPYHAANTYVKRLIDKGYKIAVCDQMSDPATSKGLVERKVTRIITPGTVIEDFLLDESRNNFLAAIAAKDGCCGMVFGDLSTGELHVYSFALDSVGDISAELTRYRPSEMLFNQSFLDNKEITAAVREKLRGCSGELKDESYFDVDDSFICGQFTVDNISTLGLADKPAALSALSALMRYFTETQKSSVERFTGVILHNSGDILSLGESVIRNLELTENIRTKERRGSLMWVVDATVTSSGRRKLRSYIERPLTDPLRIYARLSVVEELTRDISLLDDIRDSLKGVYDLERLMTRVIYKNASPRDILALGRTFQKLPEVKTSLQKLQSPLAKELHDKIPPMTKECELILNAISAEPPARVSDGGYIADGFNERLDKLRLLGKDSKAVLAEIEKRERERTGIKNLRVSFNRVFGYYIEVSKSFTDKVPADYVRKQTLSTGERYITDELKQIEGEILGAADKAAALEAEIFEEIRGYICESLSDVQSAAEGVSTLDVLQGFARVSADNGYCRPDVTLGETIEIKDGRHPVVQKMLTDEPFTPNDVLLDTKSNRLLLITGPNMSGKSTFMRQTALIVIMAQMGCFVPAKSAVIGAVDKIYTRIGAGDDLAAGQSTFMVEMNELAEILTGATRRSLVILDEVGRGTSTFDGISIAKAAAEYIASKKLGCRTLFATHYHELISLEKEGSGIKNFSVAVNRVDDTLRFLHKIVSGGADDSYGIEVAKLAGIPDKVVKAAKRTLKSMELSSKIDLERELKESEEEETQADFSRLARERVIMRLKSAEVDRLTPLEALKLLAELKSEL
ncbi:MAG: DNA mismatch repair protein MutS [Oscillospiraceae bacterium]|jgi:DNA mismatch repair protein MutS|nr:DNA mismatch repair protein MutS [Oscillospiraceae bacterium]